MNRCFCVAKTHERSAPLYRKLLSYYGKSRIGRSWPFEGMEVEQLPPIEISPMALFQIIKDIKMGPSRGFASGELCGMPCDPKDLTKPIEVTSAFPAFSRSLQKVDCENDQAEFAKFRRDAHENLKDHLLCAKKLNMDCLHIGSYTSRDCGRILSAKDIRPLFEEQSRYPHWFKLVVTMDSQSINVEAFMLSKAAMKYLTESNYFESCDTNCPHVDTSMKFEKMLVKPRVSFKCTPLDQAFLKQMLSGFSLIADVFKLRNLASLKPDVDTLADTLDDLTKDTEYVVKDKKEITENTKARQAWLEERIETNKQRREKGLGEWPESDIDKEVPKKKPISKHSFTYHAYEYHAKKNALDTAIKEEETKIKTLMALGGQNE